MGWSLDVHRGGAHTSKPGSVGTQRESRCGGLSYQLPGWGWEKGEGREKGHGCGDQSLGHLPPTVVTGPQEVGGESWNSPGVGGVPWSGSRRPRLPAQCTARPVHGGWALLRF